MGQWGSCNYMREKRGASFLSAILIIYRDAVFIINMLRTWMGLMMPNISSWIMVGSGLDLDSHPDGRTQWKAALDIQLSPTWLGGCVGGFTPTESISSQMTCRSEGIINAYQSSGNSQFDSNYNRIFMRLTLSQWNACGSVCYTSLQITATLWTFVFIFYFLSTFPDENECDDGVTGPQRASTNSTIMPDNSTERSMFNYFLSNCLVIFSVTILPHLWPLTPLPRWALEQDWSETDTSDSISHGRLRQACQKANGVFWG